MLRIKHCETRGHAESCPSICPLLGAVDFWLALDAPGGSAASFSFLFLNFARNLWHLTFAGTLDV